MQMSELLGKDFRTLIMKMLQQAIRNMIETSRKIEMKN